MNCRGPAPRTAVARAFSLTETVLAMGVVAFCLLALLGLLVPALQGLRSSEDDSKIPSMVQDVQRQIRAEIATSADFETPPAPWVESKRVFHFSPDAVALSAEDAGEAFYQVTASLADPPPGLPNVSRDTLKSLSVTVEWPLRKDGQPSANVRRYALLLRNPGYIPPEIRP